MIIIGGFDFANICSDFKSCLRAIFLGYSNKSKLNPLISDILNKLNCPGGSNIKFTCVPCCHNW